MNLNMKDSLRDVWEGVHAQRGRVGLSLLAISVGTIALALLIAVLSGLERRSQQIVRELGVNVFAITQSKSAENRTGALKQKHLETLTANLPEASVSGIRTYDVPTPGIERNVTVVATDAQLMAVRQWTLTAGRFLDATDLRERARNVVICSSLGRQWRRHVGDAIVLRNMPYEIVGIVDTGATALDNEDTDAGLTTGERSVFVPATTPPRWITFGHQTPYLDAVFVRVEDATRFESAVRRSRWLLDQPDLRVGGLSWITPDTLLKRIRRLQNTIKLTVGSIALLCLVLGGTTLMSLMVANVRDRVVEIGLRRSLGATPGDIALLFVLEACMVTTIGAAAGTVLTHAALALGGQRLPVPVALGPVTWLGPIAVAVGLGMLFSYWPARSAARIQPSEALRNE